MEHGLSVTRLKRLWLVAALVLLPFAVLCPVTMAGDAGNGGTSSDLVLARVEAPGMINDLPVPVHADLVDGQGVYYALVLAPRDLLQDAGVVATVLDVAPAGTRYLLAAGRDPAERQAAGTLTQVLYDDGRRVVVRDAPGLTAGLSRQGLFPRPLSPTPLEFGQAPGPIPRRTLAGIVKNAQVDAMLAKVTQQNFSDNISRLSGETAVTVEGAPYTITTRHTSSGIPIQKATEYLHEQLEALNLTASYHDWTSGTYSGRNVIGEWRGTTKPTEIILMVAHLDSINDKAASPNDPAPGADDDASGCSALLLAASIMKDCKFERTIRFVFTTGEENGLLGSDVYAKKLKSESQNVLGVINLDMVGYSKQTSPVQNLHTRVPQNPGYQADMAIATLFVNVVDTYGLSQNLAPFIRSESNDEGDHYSFWNNSFPSIMVIEDHNNFNPNYHCKLNMDALQYLNLPYSVANTKASIGTAAHLAGPLTPALDGQDLLLLQSP